LGATGKKKAKRKRQQCNFPVKSFCLKQYSLREKKGSVQSWQRQAQKKESKGVQENHEEKKERGGHFFYKGQLKREGKKGENEATWKKWKLKNELFY